MRTHPDIGLVIRDLLRLARFWLCNDSGGHNNVSVLMIVMMILLVVAVIDYPN